MLNLAGAMHKALAPLLTAHHVKVSATCGILQGGEVGLLPAPEVLILKFSAFNSAILLTLPSN